MELKILQEKAMHVLMAIDSNIWYSQKKDTTPQSAHVYVLKVIALTLKRLELHEQLMHQKICTDAHTFQFWCSAKICCRD